MSLLVACSSFIFPKYIGVHINIDIEEHSITGRYTESVSFVKREVFFYSLTTNKKIGSTELYIVPKGNR